ncbi:hypothetical protein Droror1_Dr00016473 [Drosera rotundifolia]
MDVTIHLHRPKRVSPSTPSKEKNMDWIQQKIVWHRSIFPRYGFIVWLVCHDRLCTKQKLCRMGVIVEDGCVLCNKQVETWVHIFFVCDNVIQVLRGLEAVMKLKIKPRPWI